MSVVPPASESAGGTAGFGVDQAHHGLAVAELGLDLAEEVAVLGD